MASAKKMLMDIIEPTVERQYGGGLDDAYMTLSQRRDSAFADPNATSAFASPMSMGGLPTIYRQSPGGVGDGDNEDYSDYGFSDNLDDSVFGQEATGSGAFGDQFGSYQDQMDAAITGQKENTSPSLESLVDQGIIDYDEAFGPGETIRGEYYPSIMRNMLDAERADRAEARGEYQNWYSGRGAPSLDPRSVRSLSEKDKATVQSLIDRDKMQGLGIPIANMLERQYGLRTFEKGLRGPLENYSQGSAKGRDDPTYITDDDAPEDVKRLALEFRYAKPGETIQQFANRFEEETGRAAPLEYFGFDRNSARDMNKNVQDVNAAMQANNLRGIGQGLGLFAGILSNPLTGINALTRGYTGEIDSEGRPVTSTALGSVYDRVEGGISGLLSKDKEAPTQEFRNETEAREFLIDQNLEKRNVSDEDRRVTNEMNELDKINQERVAKGYVLMKVPEPWQFGREGLSHIEKRDIQQRVKETDRINSYIDSIKEKYSTTDTKNVRDSEFKQAEEIAREQLGREPTLEEVNKVNMSRSGVTLIDVLRATDNPLGFALDRIASGRPTTDADIARERMTTKDLSREGLLELVPEPSLEQKIKVSDEDRKLAYLLNKDDKENRPTKKSKERVDTQRRVNQADRINAIIDLNIKEREEAPKQESKSFGQQIIDFFSSAGSPAIPDKSTNLGSNDTVERRRVAKPTQKQVAAIAKEAAKIPEEVQKTITSAGLLPQYLALIRAGYTAERAIKAIGLPAGTAIA